VHSLEGANLLTQGADWATSLSFPIVILGVEMDFEARKQDIVREIAADLAPEFGDDFVTAVEKQLAQQGRRGGEFGWSEAIALAGLLLTCVQIAIQLRAKSDKEDLPPKLEADAPKPEGVSDEKRRTIIRCVADWFSGVRKN
jgi:hypothetical protein